MLKDKKGRWVKILEINEKLWKEMMQETLQGIIKLLESVDRLLNNGGNEAICAGLYTFAVEEYGKLLLLENYSPSSGKIQVKYKDEFRNHTEKFRIAIEHLPKECMRLYEAGFGDGFGNGFEKIRVIADFEARLGIFYCDFTDSGDGIKPLPSVDKDRLKKAIDQFKAIAFKISIT
jgi:AbiV family abortive infection protein